MRVFSKRIINVLSLYNSLPRRGVSMLQTGEAKEVEALKCDLNEITQKMKEKETLLF